MIDMIMPMLAAATINYDTGRIVGYVLISLMVVLSIALVIVILLQKSGGEDMSAIAGYNSKNESFFSKNKTQSTEGRLKKATIAISVLLLLTSVIYFIILSLSGIK